MSLNSLNTDLFDFCEDFAKENRFLPSEFETEDAILGSNEINKALTHEQKTRLAQIIGQTH
jgi:hypothetical protein